MSHYHYSAIIIIIILILVNSLTFARTIPSSSSSFKEKLLSKKDETNKLKDLSSSIHDRLKPSSHEDILTTNIDEEDSLSPSSSSSSDGTANVVVLTSLSGIYIWWPILFGGDDSFHLLLSQEDVPRFHDVTGDEHGHIYLTAPHERTVYRLQYSDGWWISNFSNHSVMNSIRSEMPLFVTIHHISSMLYVYGHSDIQIIDLLQRPRTRGSAPFMKRLRELSPNLRISDFIIDQLTSEGYIIGDSYGWCTIIRCSLNVNECDFLFKIPSSYDNRPYPCTATIDFSSKIMYLSLEEKILGVHLNQQTDYDRRFTLTDKRGPRSTLGYDDIITYNNTILYTDVLRPLLHICTSMNTNPCLNISLSFPSQRTILPLRLSVIQVPNFRPPAYDDEDDNDSYGNQSDNHLEPSSLLAPNQTSYTQPLIADVTTNRSSEKQQTYFGNIWVLFLGICIGLLIAGVSFMIYYVTLNKNRPHLKHPNRPSSSSSSSSSSSTTAASRPNTRYQASPSTSDDTQSQSSSKTRSSKAFSADSSQSQRLIDDPTYANPNGSIEWTTSSSYQPETVL